MTAIRCARPVTTSMWCSTISTVLPSSACTERISSTSSGTSSIETPAIGSSSRSTRGRPASSIASSSLRLSPCESRPAGHELPPGEADPADRPRRPLHRFAHRGCPPPDPHRPARSPPPRRAGRSRAPTAAERRSTPGTSCRARPCARRTAAGRSRRRRPVRRVPLVGRCRPETRLKSVVLPAPFGPITASSSPSRTSSPTSATMVAPPMSSPRSLVARIGDALTR